MEIVYRFDQGQPLTRFRAESGGDAVEALCEGNARFVNAFIRLRQEMKREQGAREITIQSDAMALGVPYWSGGLPTQAPFALVLGCADARVPIEKILDQPSNSLFVVRVAGNVLGVEGLGSVAYAARHLGENMKVMVVLGHRHCGAVGAAVDTYLSVADYATIGFTFALRSLVDRILVAVRASATALVQEFGYDCLRQANYRNALIDTACYLNAGIQAFDLSRELEALDHRDLRVVHGVVDLETQRVGVVPPSESMAKACFEDAPRSPADLEALAKRITQAIRATGQLTECHSDSPRR